MVDGRDSKAGFFQEKFLDLVIGFCCLQRSQIACAGDTRDLPHPIFQLHPHFFLVQLPLSLELIKPISTELADLLLQGHLRQ